MPRRLRFAAAGYVHPVLNRAVARATLFGKPADYVAFEKVLQEAKEWRPMRLLAYCIMPNHWHLVLWPRRSVVRGCPFGDLAWMQATAAQLGLQTTLRPRGRPRRQEGA